MGRSEVNKLAMEGQSLTSSRVKILAQTGIGTISIIRSLACLRLTIHSPSNKDHISPYSLGFESLAPLANAHAQSTMAKKSAAASTSTSSKPSTTTTPPQPSSKTTTPTLSSKSSPRDVALHIWNDYLQNTPSRTFLLDAFLGFLVLVGVIQFVYAVLFGNYVRWSSIL